MQTHLPRIQRFFVLALAASLFCACSTFRTTDPDKLRALYENAVRDAEVAEPDEISNRLVALTPWNDDLVWRGDGEDAELKVVTWTSWDGYDDLVGGSTDLSREVWVTAVPQLREFCRSKRLSPRRAALRIEQLLGLPPDNGKTKFVELWVRPADLFRPSPDPEIGDHEAQLATSSSSFVSVSDEHRRWIEDLKASSYGENGYPWTRLGYTYDWGHRRSEVGLSEFVVRAGATVGVAKVASNAEYCFSRASR